MKSILGSLGALVNRMPVAYTPRNSTALGMPGLPGAVSQMAAMGANGTLFSIVNKLSTATAAADWHMHRLSGNSRTASNVCPICEKQGVQLVEAHPALSVWNRPNNFFSRQEFVESGQQHIDLTGESWWVVLKVGDRPVELWPVRPDRMAPVRSAEKFTSGYLYRSPDGTDVPLGLDEVVFIRMPNPLDPWRGMGPVQSIMANLDSARFSAEWNRNFFLNSAEPGGVLTAPGNLQDAQFERLRMQWNEQHRGLSNAHRVAILEGGVTWTSRQYTQKDMQFVELAASDREVIREAFGVHGHILGLSEDVNRANADAADVSFARRLTVPRLDRFKGALNNDFLPMFGSLGKGYEFAYASPVPEDREADNAERASRTTSFKTLVDAGVNPEDAALVVGLPPMRTGQPVMAGATDGGQNGS